MTQEHIDYVKNNMLLFTTSRRYLPGELQKIFDIYNEITGENKPPTSCGRCVTTVKNTILHDYKKLL
jgi:hypothetical protein